MIKRALYFGIPAYLKTKNEQLVIEIPDTDESKSVSTPARFLKPGRCGSKLINNQFFCFQKSKSKDQLLPSTYYHIFNHANGDEDLFS